jgi:ActR/RegA family two-component response regulator
MHLGLLIVEDDPTFAKILCDLARERDLKCMIALRGDKALTMAQELEPDAITLDIRLPDMAADRQAQSGASIFAAGRSIGLAEGLEDRGLLVFRNADAGVLHDEGDY